MTPPKRLTLASIFALMICMSGPRLVCALPEGENVVAGQAAFDRSASDTLTITTPSDKLIVDYSGFNIAQAETVHFNQPSSSSIALNRVVGQDPTSILGTLTANGRIFIVNPNGVIFGAGSKVDVAGLVASSLNISNDDFLNGRYTFSAEGKNSFIANNGQIDIRNGGYAILLAGAVENAGSIEANLGTVILASGENATIALDDASDISVVVNEAVKSAVLSQSGEKISSAVKNSGTITADGGKVILTAKVLNNVFDYALNNTGIVQAKSIVSHNGAIELVAEGAPVVNSGSLSAGRVTVNSDSSFLNAAAGRISADGYAGLPNGGQIALKIAAMLQQGIISADANENGTAGNVEIISEDSTTVDSNSTTSARALGLVGNGGRIFINTKKGNTTVNREAVVDVSAGAISGDGGFIEISALRTLDFAGIINGRAPPGFRSGIAILDPTDATVSGTISADTTVWATNNVTISGAITINSNNTLNLFADHNSATANDWHDGVGAILDTGSFTITGGTSNSRTLVMKAGSGVGSSAKPILTSNITDLSADINPSSAGTIYIQNSGTVAIDVSSLTTKNGNVYFSSVPNVTATTVSTNGSGNITLEVTGAGKKLTLDGALTIGAGGSGLVSLNGSDGVTLSGAGADIVTQGGLLMIAADGDYNNTGTYSHSNVNSTVTTNGGAVTITAANISLSGTNTSQINAGSGDISLVPSTTNRTIGLAGSAGNFDIGDQELENLATTGLVTIGSNGTTGAATIGAVDLSAETYNLQIYGGSVTHSSGTLTLSTGKSLTLTANNSNINIQRAIIASGAGTITLTAPNGVSLSDSAADITTAGGALIIDADTDQNNTGTYSQTNAGASVVTNGGNITISAADFSLTSTSSLNSGSGNITIEPSTTGRTIGLNSASGLLNLTATELTNLASSGTVTIGKTGGTGAVTLGDSGAIDLSAESYNLSLIGGDTTLSGNLTLATNKSLTISSSGSITQSSGASVVSNGGSISFSSSGNISLALLNATAGAVSVISSNGSILDNDGGVAPTDKDIIAGNVTLNVGGAGTIGQSGANNEIDLQYSGTLSENVLPSNASGASGDRAVNAWVSGKSNDNTVDVSWTAATDANYYTGSGIDGYYIVWDTSATTIPIASDTKVSTAGTTSLSLADGTNYYFHIRAVDKAGNLASSGSTVHVGKFYIDTTLPVITAQRDPGSAANANGWNNTNVLTSYSASDALSGLSSAATGSFTFTFEGTGQSITFHATDLAGNSNSATISNVKIDKTAPTISAGTPTGTAGTNGWWKSNVTVPFTAADTLSGFDVLGTLTTSLASKATSGEGTSLSVTSDSITDMAGNAATVVASGPYKVDKTAPVLTYTRTAANANGWNNTNVTVNFSATDSLSGITSIFPSNMTLSGEAANQSAFGMATDKAGNTTSVLVNNINIDKTAPTISAQRDTLANANGWNNTNVLSSYSASDTLSGLSSAASGTFTFTSEAANQSHIFTVSDLADNSSSATVSSISIDKTAPVVTAAATTSPNANNWYNSNITVNFTASDPLSGLASVDPSTVISSEGNNVSATGTATDLAGNTGSGTLTANLDKTAPTISAQRDTLANANGWNNTNVLSSYSASDTLSGLSSAASGTFTFTSEAANQSHIFTISDLADNSSSATVSSISIDKTDPVVVIAGPLAGVHNTPQTLQYTVTDNLTAAPAITGPANNSVFNTIGTHTILVAATDLAGNSSAALLSFAIDIADATEAQLTNASIVRPLMPDTTQLGQYQTTNFPTFGPVYLYHPLVELDTQAFDSEFNLEEGAYEFIDGVLNIHGHDHILPILEEVKKKRKMS